MSGLLRQRVWTDGCGWTAPDDGVTAAQPGSSDDKFQLRLLISELVCHLTKTRDSLSDPSGDPSGDPSDPLE